MNTFGIRAHDLGSFETPQALAERIRTFGPKVPVQLAIAKSFPSLGPLTEDLAHQIKEAFDEQGVTVTVLGSYINPIHPDLEERNRQLKQFENHLKFASILGAEVVGTETGSIRPDCSYHPETADPNHVQTLYASLDRLVEYAAKVGSVVGVEAVAKQNTISSIERMTALAERFDTPHLKIIYDPVNLIPWIGIPEADGSYRAKPTVEAQRVFTNQALDGFGSRIVALHVKDFALNENGFKIGDLPVLEGVFDWPALLADLRERKISVPALLENANPATLAKTLSTLSSF